MEASLLRKRSHTVIARSLTLICFCLCTGSLLLAVSTRAQTTDAADYFPLNVGNEWVLATISDPPGEPFDTTVVGSLEVLDPVTFGNVAYFPLEDLDDTARHYRQDDTGRVWRYFPESEDELLWFDFTRQDSSSYKVVDPMYGFTMTVFVRRGLTADTPAGHFEACVGLFFDDPDVADEEMYYIFAPGVGLVRRYGAWTNEVLYTATIDGRVVTPSEKPEGHVGPALRATNFPNPFRQTTVLSFRLAQPGFVTLTIYDALGRTVATGLAEHRGAGRHTLRWEAPLLPAGVYYAQLRTPATQASVKMLLVK